MDPLSIISGVAASAQFLEQGSKITKFLWDLKSKMKEAPATIRKHVVHIDLLIDLFALFSDNASLQEDSVTVILQSCLLQAQDFHQMLEKMSSSDTDNRFRKLKKKFDAVIKEKEIEQLFARLEREKNSLVLSIQRIDNTLLYSINTLASTLPGMSIHVAEIHTAVHSLQKPMAEVEASNRSFWLVPNRRVNQFVGRKDVLERIELGFSSTGDLPQKIVTIRGLGGQGKTQVALEYCRRAKTNGVRAIFWVDATSESSVQKGFVAVSEAIKDPGEALEDERRVGFVKEKLLNWPDSWILIFDNYDDPSAFHLPDYIPEGDQGRILVTSRHSGVDALAFPENAIKLEGLPDGDALALLSKHSRVAITESNIQHGEAIIRRLAYHALAISQAGSYMHLQKIQLHQFIDHYDKQRKDILDQSPQMTQYRRKLDTTAEETALTVFTTWELSFQLLQKDAPGRHRAQVLTLFAFWDSKDISEELFKPYCMKDLDRDSDFFGERLMACFLDDDDTWDHQNFVQTLINLEQMSLLQAWSRDEDEVCHLNLHPLIRDWIRLRITINSFQDYSIIASNILSTLLNKSYMTDGHFDLPLSTRLTILSHIDIHAENLQSLKAKMSSEIINTLYSDFQISEAWFSMFLEQNGRLDKAEEMGLRVVTWREAELGLEDETTLTALNNLALLLRQQGKYEEAEEIFRCTLQNSEKVLGPEHPDTLGSLNNLATVLQGLGKLEEAEEMHRRTLQSQEKVLGPEHPSTLTSLNNLALMLRGLGKYEEAEEMCQRTLQSSEKVLGPEHPGTLTSLNNLALVLQDLGKYKEAEKMHRCELQSSEKVLGPEHPDTLTSLNNLAFILQDLGKCEEAEEMHRRTLQISEKVLGPEHPDTLLSVWSLAMLLKDRRRRDEALSYYKRASEGYKKVAGENHPNTLRFTEDYLKLMTEIEEESEKSPTPAASPIVSVAYDSSCK